MIIYGTRSFKGKPVVLNNSCPNCNTTGQLVFQSAIRYFHIFWIPIFPFQKIVVGQCQHCKKVYDKKSFDSSLYSISNQLKQKQKYSIFHFAGLILIAGIIIWNILPDSEKTKKEKELNLINQQNDFQAKLNDPKVNDIFFVNTGDTTISGKTYRKSLVLKVINTQVDSIDFELSGLLKLDKKLSGNSYASMGLTDDCFSPENIYSNSIRESKNKISQKLILNDLSIYRIDRQ